MARRRWPVVRPAPKPRGPKPTVPDAVLDQHLKDHPPGAIHTANGRRWSRADRVKDLNKHLKHSVSVHALDRALIRRGITL